MKGEKALVTGLKLGGVEEMVEEIQERAAERRLAAPRQEDALQRKRDTEEAERLETAASVASWYLREKRMAKMTPKQRSAKDVEDFKAERLLQRREQERRRVARRGANPPQFREDSKLPKCREWKAERVIGKPFWFEAVDEGAARVVCQQKGWKFLEGKK